MNQRQRSKTIERLRQGKIQFLVATDVAARGIDISTLSHVINFDLPFVAEDFIHRIGRTGRAGAKGNAITFATFKEKFRINDIAKILGKQIEVHTIEGMEPRTVEKTKPSFADKNRGPRARGFRGQRFGSRDDARSFKREGEAKSFKKDNVFIKEGKTFAGFAKKRKEGFSAPADFGGKKKFSFKKKGF
jgi:superfamily II DNA/RNA helicase